MAVMVTASPIGVVSDVVCPWCFIGKRRLEKALALAGRQGEHVLWKAFELNPQAPKEGMDRQAYRARKFGSADYARELEARVIEAGSEEGIEFRFDRIERVPNTLDAHRLIWLAGREGEQDAIVENLFRAYFIDGQDVGNRDVLRRIAVESGLDSTLADGLLNTDLGEREVRDEEREAHARGVSGVPTFFVKGLPVMSGAQTPELLASAFGTALGQCSLDDGACA
ncbi:MAG TPA: DsbA family oxidoreductase [Bryobacteraceae bacterium]|nr:DsbA family oxidoreductase [Bryobacteraceae bacterium]